MQSFGSKTTVTASTKLVAPLFRFSIQAKEVGLKNHQCFESLQLGPGIPLGYFLSSSLCMCVCVLQLGSCFQFFVPFLKL